MGFKHHLPHLCSGARESSLGSVLWLREGSAGPAHVHGDWMPGLAGWSLWPSVPDHGQEKVSKCVRLPVSCHKYPVWNGPRGGVAVGEDCPVAYLP